VKKSGIVNSELLKAIGELGHMDLICVADAGLPIPASVIKIDLTLVLGFPPIDEVLRALAVSACLKRRFLLKRQVKGIQLS
jgi:D-ribose pyranase